MYVPLMSMVTHAQEGRAVERSEHIKVWDPLVRIFHWTLVGAFALAYLTAEDFLLLHSWAGYTVLGLIVVRLLWGFIGTRYARFSSFVHPPTMVWRYLKDIVLVKVKRHVGHNPAGGAMIVMLLVSLSLTIVSGLIALGAGDSAGPLAPWLGSAGEGWAQPFEEIHEFFANLTLMLVFIHLAGVMFASLLHRENLVRAMFTGYKRREPEAS
jgi:cytochrome b